LRIKEKVIQERKYVAEQATQLKKEGSSLSQVCQYLNSNYVNFRFIERSVYRGRKSSPRISFSFPVFEEYLKEATKNLGETGQVWDEIVLKEEVDYKDYVYDFTVLDENHNFIANSFVVSNCGVRVLRTNLKEDEIRPKMRSLVDTIFRNVPSGVGSKGRVKLSWGQLEEAIEIGARWAVENGYGTEKDLEHLEEKGSLPGKASVVSEKAKKRGMPQLGSLGAGNHFLEIQRVDGIFDKDAARVMGIEEEGQICVMIHTGSRGFGHQVCTDYLKILESKFRDIIAKLPDRELVYAPANTKECENYFYAMNSAANFAWCNRQMITHWVRESITSALGIKEEDVGLEVIYDVAHNIGKVEEHKVNGEVKKVYVHRKGATRAFGPGSPDIPKDYKKIGQPVLIPGSMGTSSYILIGTERAEEETFSSVCHGAGRLQSRAKALKKFRGEQVKRSLEGEGITVRSASWKVLAEEAPPVYKDVDEVVKTCEVAGICKIVVRLKPIGVVKG
jgi:tRNA-splicing ligase RtcB